MSLLLSRRCPLLIPLPKQLVSRSNVGRLVAPLGCSSYSSKANKGVSSASSPLPRSASYLLFVTHHLLAASKQEDLRKWSKEFRLLVLAKRGYPGVVLLVADTDGPDEEAIAESGSEQKRLKEVGKKIKNLRWASKDFRPIQSIAPELYQSLSTVLRSQSESVTSPVSAIHFVDSMKDISALFAEADRLSTTSSLVNRTTETWQERWKREMKPS